jgi:hypothetical protein
MHHIQTVIYRIIGLPAYRDFDFLSVLSYAQKWLAIPGSVMTDASPQMYFPLMSSTSALGLYQMFPGSKLLMHSLSGIQSMVPSFKPVAVATGKNSLTASSSAQSRCYAIFWIWRFLYKRQVFKSFSRAAAHTRRSCTDEEALNSWCFYNETINVFLNVNVQVKRPCLRC